VSLTSDMAILGVAVAGGIVAWEVVKNGGIKPPSVSLQLPPITIPPVISGSGPTIDPNTLCPVIAAWYQGQLRGPFGLGIFTGPTDWNSFRLWYIQTSGNDPGPIPAGCYYLIVGQEPLGSGGNYT